MSENLKLWNSVSVTDPKYTKSYSNGMYKGTAIDPQWQAMRATEAFGPFGIGWGLEDENYRVESLDEKTKLLIYTGILWYVFDGKRGVVPVTSAVRVMYQARADRMIYDDEATKKVQTNAISKGLSRLGFSADVFLGKFDDSKYVELAKSIADAEKVVDESERKHLARLLTDSEADTEAFLKHFKCDLLEEFPALRYHEAVGMLTTKLRKLKADATKPKTETAN